jgi:hypothetical protein
MRLLDFLSKIFENLPARPSTFHPMNKHDQLLNFLQENLALSQSSIEMGLKQTKGMPNLLPIVLYKYGFITSQELGKIFDWLETA